MIDVYDEERDSFYDVDSLAILKDSSNTIPIKKGWVLKL